MERMRTLPEVHGRVSVLIVDVDPARLARIEREASQAGICLLAAMSFRGARVQIRRSCPDVLVAAVRLEAYNGLHLAAIVGQDHPECAAFVFSDGADHGAVSDAESLGACCVTTQDVLQPQFWESIAACRMDTAVGDTSGLLRAPA
jgi:DNA-binding NarL/FixJ family response regulator